MNTSQAMTKDEVLTWMVAQWQKQLAEVQSIGPANFRFSTERMKANQLASLIALWCAEHQITVPEEPGKKPEPVEANRAVQVTAVAEVKRDGEGMKVLRWLLEGGIHELCSGTVLVMADAEVTDENGHGQVFLKGI